MFKLQTRLLLLLLLLTTAFMTGIVLWNRREAAKMRVIMAQSQQERNAFCDRLIALKGNDLQTFASDYTYWDEMVNFVRTRDRKWATQNLDAGLSTFHALGVWVFNAEEKLVYSVNDKQDPHLKNLPLPHGALRAILAKAHLGHFFLPTSQGLAEVRCATIHATADPHRTGRVYGYFFTARLWGADFLKELGSLTGGRVEILSSSHKDTADSPYTIRFTQTLPDWNGQSQLRLTIVSEQATLKMVAAAQHGANRIALVFLLALMALLSLCLFAWVDRPLGRIVQALQGKEKACLEPLVNAQTEFGHVARLICAFSDQKSVLEQEVLERQRAEAAQRWQASHDALTGLPNRALFMSQLEEAHSRFQKEGCHLAVLFLDLDHFKLVNDSLGHEAGDHLLIEVAKRMQQNARQGDLVARLAGDEFTMLLEGITDVAEVVTLADRLLHGLQLPVRLGQTEFFPSGSIGIACTEAISASPGDLLRDADTAMYHAKMHGKNGFALFEPSMNANRLKQAELETALHYALERKELCVYYQPIINLSTGQMEGTEALVRWNRPEKGLVMPGEFISIAEDTGLIVPLGYWVLEEACRQSVEWKRQFPHCASCTMNVNLSGRQLQREDIVDRIDEILTRTGLEPSTLKLEITESVMMADVEAAVAKMQRLKKMGVQLALDDFGTGYSSIASLHNFPLDNVKMDRTFIRRLSEHPEALSLITAIVLIARALRMEVTAEGVETAEQITLLQGVNCDFGQGYFFAPPLTAAQFESRFAAGSELWLIREHEVNKNRIESYLQAIPTQQKAA